MQTVNDKFAKQVSQSGPLFNVAPVANYPKQYKDYGITRPKNFQQAPSTVNPFK